MRIHVLLVFCYICLQIYEPVYSANEPGLLVVSLDGFGANFLNTRNTPFINSLRQYGCTTPYVQNVFPTKTLTNHFSLATGRFPYEHGVFNREVWDRKYGKVSGYQLYHYDDSIIPIWVIISKNYVP